MEKENQKQASEIFEGTWELIVTNPAGKKYSDEVTIKSGKYYKSGEYVYDFKPEFVGKNILIHKCEISNNAKYFFERIDYISEDYQILSGDDEKENKIEYIKQHVVYFKVL